MRILLTAGPTREPIDAVRFIGNRSSGRMGAAIAQAAIQGGHSLTLIVGPVHVPFPSAARRVEVETAAQMHEAVLREFPKHDLLIMAAAVADYRPIAAHAGKMPRQGTLTIECEATEDIIARAGKIKRADQRTIGFSLEARGNLERAKEKLVRKNLDLIVYNPTETMDSDAIEPTLLWRDGRMESLASLAKGKFAEVLIQRGEELFP